MNRTRRITIAATGVLVCLLGLHTTSTAAFALIRPAKTGPARGGPIHTPLSTVANSGMAGWEIGVIAIAAAVFASALIVVVLRARLRPTVRPATS